MKQLCLLLLLPPIILVHTAILSAQVRMTDEQHPGELIIAPFDSAPFPHPQRRNGHQRNTTLYSAEAHYQDNRVAIFIPRGYQRTSTVDMVFHFHGWHGRIEQVLDKYHLTQQFYQSGKNAILVVPQGPRDAEDSFGGKLEDENGFRRLVAETLHYLRTHRKIDTETPGAIVLSGHSGAYRVMASILERGGLASQIREVYLFDALYGATDRYVSWIDRHHGKLINIFTPGGGTQGESRKMIAKVDSLGLPYRSLKEEEAPDAVLRDSRLVFLSSALQHDQVIHAHQSFMKYLRASALDDRAVDQA